MRCALLSRKAVQLYVLVILGVFCYLHYCRGGTKDVTLSSRLDYYSATELVPVHHERTATQHVNRFILGLNYWEQFTMATMNLFSLVCLGKLWNARTVQPFTFNSRLYGLQNFKPDDNFKQNRSALSLDLIYNTNSLSKHLLSLGLPELANFKTFLKHASRNVVVTHYISPKETRELAVMKGAVKDAIEQGFRKDFIIDCKYHLSGYLNMIQDALNSGLSSYRSVAPQNQFYVGKYWCINMTELSTPHESALKMQLGMRGDVSIIVVNWRGMGKNHIVRNSVKGEHLNNRIAMSGMCKHSLGTNWRNVISYSPFVVQASGQFAVSLGLSPADMFAVIHIRSEKLGLREARLPGVTLACFEKLMRQREGLAQEFPSLRFIYITDYGPYSSDTCKKCRGSRGIKKYLFRKKIETTYFDPVNFNVTLDSGFAAAVESHFMASANYLFLCGGGGYQNQIATRFQEQKHKMKTNDAHKMMFKVCSDDGDISKALKVKSNDVPSL